MDDIQEEIVKKNGRGVLARAFYAKSDKDAIAAWKQEFSKILQIFQVRSVGSVWHLLIMSSQTELAVNTHVVVASGRREVTDIHQEVTDIRQDVLVIRESVSNRRRVVCQW